MARIVVNEFNAIQFVNNKYQQQQQYLLKKNVVVVLVCFHYVAKQIKFPNKQFNNTQCPFFRVGSSS